MVGTRPAPAPSQSCGPFNRCASPVGSTHTRQTSNNNITVASGNHDNGVLLNIHNSPSANTGSASDSLNSGRTFLSYSLVVRHTDSTASNHISMASSDHIMDQDSQTNNYNEMPGAQSPLSAEDLGGVPVQQFSQLTVGTTNVQYAEGVSDYSSAPHAQSSIHHSQSSDSWLHNASVTHENSGPGATNRDSPASRIAEASFDLIAQGEFNTATTSDENKGKGKDHQGIYTSSSSGSSSTRFSADHTSNHHIQARIETKTSKPASSKSAWVLSHLRDRTHDGQVQRPVREPVAPGHSQGVVPPNNFNRRAPASSQANGRRGLTYNPHPIYNTGFNGADAARQAAAHQQQSGSAQSFNQAFGTFQDNGLAPRNSTIRQTPVGTRPSAVAASFGSAQQAGDAVNMADAVAGQGHASFAPAGEFRPMNAVTRPYHHPDLDSQRDLKARLGISPNYAGDATIARNQSAPIPDSENVAFWITNLPPNVTHSQLLGQVRGMGRVWACVISPPTGDHVTSAAKLVFFELAAAQRFYAHCSNPRRRLIVGGYVAHVCLNRTKKAEEDVGGNRSRVVVIMGDPSFVNPRTLLGWFRDHFEYEIDEVITHVLNNEMGHVEIRFGSWRSQAESCRQAIKTVYPPGGTQSPVWVFRYGTDPCSI